MARSACSRNSWLYFALIGCKPIDQARGLSIAVIFLSAGSERAKILCSAAAAVKHLNDRTGIKYDFK
jgi:hypothetical protein